MRASTASETEIRQAKIRTGSFGRRPRLANLPLTSAQEAADPGPRNRRTPTATSVTMDHAVATPRRSSQCMALSDSVMPTRLAPQSTNVIDSKSRDEKPELNRRLHARTAARMRIGVIRNSREPNKSEIRGLPATADKRGPTNKEPCSPWMVDYEGRRGMTLGPCKPIRRDRFGWRRSSIALQVRHQAIQGLPHP
jgi:hypothetical protein